MSHFYFDNQALSQTFSFTFLKENNNDIVTEFIAVTFSRSAKAILNVSLQRKSSYKPPLFQNTLLQSPCSTGTQIKSNYNDAIRLNRLNSSGIREQSHRHNRREGE